MEWQFQYFFPWHKPVSEIGFVLGFAGASTYWRAFRSWDRQVAARDRATLEAAGYSVTRAAASLGAWDLVGVGSTDVLLMQVKTRDWPGPVEMETLTSFPAPPNARKLVHRHGVHGNGCRT